MSVEFLCANKKCQGTLQSSEEMRGLLVTCPLCQKTSRVPDVQERIACPRCAGHAVTPGTKWNTAGVLLMTFGLFCVLLAICYEQASLAWGLLLMFIGVFQYDHKCKCLRCANWF